MLIDSRHASNFLNVRSYRFTQLDIEHHDSDHFMLGAKIRFRVSKIGRIRSERMPKYDVEKLKNERIKNQYNSLVESALTSQEHEKAEWRQCFNAMKTAAENCLGSVQPGNKNWFDSECELAVQKIIDEQKKKQTRARVDELRRLQREKKALLRKKKREFDRRCLEEIEEFQAINDSRKYFQAVKFARKKFFPRVAICKSKEGELLCNQSSVVSRWKEYFEELLNAGTSEQSVVGSKVYEKEDGKLFAEPTLDEVREAISKLKSNKAPGEDGLPAELFKTGCSKLEIAICDIIVQFWREERMPDEWNVGVICPLHKKGCKLTCSNFRGISLLNTAYKILSKILSSRLEPHYEKFLHEYQSGFRKERSTIDQIHCARQLIHKSDERNIETLHLLIDFKAAYDSVSREELWKMMAEFKFPHKMIRLLRATLTTVLSRVRVQKFLSEKFETKTGLRQGDELSTKLFNITLEGVCRRAKLELAGTIFTKSTQLLAFADDIDIIGRNLRAITDAYSKLEREAGRMGLVINEEKTKLLMIAASTRTKQHIGSHLCIGDKKFEVVEEFKYLGSYVNSSADSSIEIKKRIHSGYGAFHSLKHILTSKSISRNTRINIYKSLVRVIVLYGSETWNTTQADEETLGVFERRVLRAIFGPIKEGNEFRSRHNHELYQLFQETEIVQTLRINRLRWAGHIYRRQEDAPVLAVTKGHFTDGKRSRGRPKNSWRVCVDKDAEMLGFSNWQKEARDRDSFRRSLRAAMGPRVPPPSK